MRRMPKYILNSETLLLQTARTLKNTLLNLRRYTWTLRPKTTL